MRIAQVAPLTESVPPKTYGGIERVVSYLTEELVARGHAVTLFASGDSKTSANHVAVIDESLRKSKHQPDPVIYHTLQLAELLNLQDNFDVVHFHIDVMQYPVWRHVPTPQLTTMHGRLDLPGLAELFREFHDMPVVSISDSQRRPIPDAHWIDTVYNGIPVDRYHFQESPGEYFAFLGRFTPEKGPEAAIEIAKRTNVPLRLAAKIDKVDEAYFAERIKPLLDHPLLEYVGEVADEEKVEFLGNAKALLFPIDWPEPFGLVMAESMACGTPVIAFNRGSVPEVLVDKLTGFVVETVDQAVEAVQQLDSIDRSTCRQHCVDHFSVQAMVDGYEEVYRMLAAESEGRQQDILRVDSPEVQPVEPAVARIPSDSNGAAVFAASRVPLYGRPIH